jgi:hypothetical protein
MAVGTPEEIAESPQSYTGHYLKRVLKRWGGAKARREPQAAE